MLIKKEKYIIVVGCGRLGSSLAGKISEWGEDVVLVDKDKYSFRKLPSVFTGFTVEGDATDEGVLKEAGANRADVLIACTENDNINLMVSQIASKIFGIAEVFVRIYDPEKQRILEGTNIKKISPTLLTLNEFEKLLLENKQEEKK